MSSESKYSDLETEKSTENILKAVMPIVIHSLLEQGLLNIEQLHDYDAIRSAIDDNPGFFSNSNVACVTEFHPEFIEAAKDAIEAKRGAVAIVLLATAIEQSLNTFYRNALAEKILFTEDQITEVIRSNNISPKIGWLLKMLTGYELEENLFKQIKYIAELRNQIVHYKAKPSIPNNFSLGGSYADIEERIQALDFDSLLSVPNDLDIFLNEALDNLRCEVLPEYKLIKEASAIFLHKRFGIKNHR